MTLLSRRLSAAVLLALAVAHGAFAQSSPVAPLPPGVRAVWDLAQADRTTTPTKEKICVNGLWRWQPAEPGATRPPTAQWGFFKVPGSWPGVIDYMQKDSQTVFTHESWAARRLGELSAAWYQRELAIPAAWAGRRIALSAAHVNSVASVWIDGTKAGEVRFPGGELDLTTACRPGSTHVLSLLVVALPLKDVLLSYADTNTAREVKGRVARRGLCGDVFLTGTPPGARIADVQVDTSYRKKQIAFDLALPGLTATGRYSIEARVSREGRLVRTFSSPPFSAAELVAGRFTFAAPWLPDLLWDLPTPGHTYELTCSLRDANGRTVDTDFATRFGFREFWIEGRDFLLNGSPIHLSVVPLDNAQVSAGLASYAGARESLERLKSIGINFVYTHNYGCEPGSHLGFDEILRAADDVGILVSFSQPHFSHYEWKAPDADRTNGYAAHAAYYVRIAQNHPAVVAYAMNHNATGYAEDMNPDLIDGVNDPREPRAQANAKLALRAEAIVRRLDAGRVIYHHSSGNLGAMHTINFYPNFAPVQELSDWFGHWASAGVKPVFLCEYGAPFTWDWTMYRGWYNGERSFGSAQVPWEFCLAEWNAQFFGDRAFQLSAPEATNLRWEAKQLAAGKVWHRWDYPHQVGSNDFDERYPVFALYLADNWPAYRTWGVSAISPWEFGPYWKPRAGIDRRRQELPVDWDHLQRPGLSADYVEGRYERMDLAFAREDWIPTVAAEALLRYNRPLLAYLAGKPAAFTSKDHVFSSGEVFEKQLIVINNSRAAVTCDATWSLNLPRALTGAKKFTVAPGAQTRLPLRLALPPALAPGDYALSATVRFDTGETQRDTFALQVVPAAPSPRFDGAIALFDPPGKTAALLQWLGIRYESVTASADLVKFDLLIVGQAALQSAAPAPDITRVRDGLKVLLFEQTAEALEKRFGFRVAEYGLRRVFPRVPDHPLLAGIGAEQLRDWRGEAMLQPSRLTVEMRPRYGATVQWCDLPVTRIWRCGNRGNVASVLIEKPARGDFLPILDGGYALQYSPLLEFREGRGVMLFSQLDLVGRTETDPVAEQLTQNLLRYLSTWQPAPSKRALYLGDPAGRAHLESAGFAFDPVPGGPPSADTVVVLGPGAARDPALGSAGIATFVKAGGHAVAFGLDQVDIDALQAVSVGLKTREHISSPFAPPGAQSPLAGIGPADLHNRDPRKIPLVASGATVLGDGVLATAAHETLAFCQLAPWTFDPTRQANLKRTFRRVAFTATRLLTNQGVASRTPTLDRFHTPTDPARSEKRWLEGLYLDQPAEWDDPYRFFRW